MRKLGTSLAISGIALLLPLAAYAQEPAAENVELEPAADATAEPEGAQPTPTDPPPTESGASGGVSFDTGTGASMNADVDSTDVTPTTPATTIPAPASSERNYGGPVTASDEEWQFGYAGYFRAPMRIGIGKRENKQVSVSTGTSVAPSNVTGAIPTQADPTASGVPVTPTRDQSGTTLHSPIIPDDQYLNWQHTDHAHKDWAELFFSYGNSWAKGTVAIQGYNFTDAAFNEMSAQFGISQAYVTIKPYMPWENVRFTLRGGNFWGRYGMAGKYDAGEYDTFLFGRTHAMGEIARVEIDLGDYTLGLEQGFGTKQPDPSVYDTTRFTLLHHEHADLTFNGPIAFTFGLHYLSSWTQSENPEVEPVAAHYLGAVNLGDAYPDGRMDVFGADGRFDFGQFGYLYAGFSRVQTEYAWTVAPAIEVIHSYGGGEYDIGIVGNYLDGYRCRFGLSTDCSNGNGAVNTLEAQYEFSAASLAEASIFGEGRDLVTSIYGMYNQIESDDPDMDGVTRLKFGADLQFDIFPVLAVGLRADHLKPHSDYGSQDFSVISPRLTFRSNWVTHEQIVLQYSRYVYAQRTCQGTTPADITGQLEDQLCVQPASGAVTPAGFGATTQNQDPGRRGAPTYVPDENVIALEASMWW